MLAQDALHNRRGRLDMGAWPTGEFAGMGLEGSVKLGRRAALAAITDLAERKARYETPTPGRAR